MYCAKCGKEIADGSKFCPFCGNETKMNDTVTTPEQNNIINNDQATLNNQPMGPNAGNAQYQNNNQYSNGQPQNFYVPQNNQQFQQQAPFYPPMPVRRTNGFGTASLTMGIIGLVFTAIAASSSSYSLLWTSLSFVAAGIVFGIFGVLQKRLPRGKAIAGLACAGTAVLIAFVIVTSGFSSSYDTQDLYDEDELYAAYNEPSSDASFTSTREPSDDVEHNVKTVYFDNFEVNDIQ